MFDLIFRKLAPYMLPHKFKLMGAVFFSVCLAGISGWQVSLVKPLFDKGLSPGAPREEVLFLAGKLLFLGILNFPCRFFHFYWLRFIRDKAMCKLRSDIFEKLLKLPTSFFTHSKQGKLISNVINDTEIFAMGFKSSIDLIREPLKAIVYLCMAFWADWQLTIVTLVTTPFFLSIFEISGRRVRHHQGLVQKDYGELTHNISESLGAHKLTKAFNLKKFISHRFEFVQKKFFSAQMKTAFIEELAHPLVEIVGVCAFAGVMIFAHHRVQVEAISVGEFIAFIAALGLLTDPIRKFSQANVHLSQAGAASDRLQSIFELPEEPDQGSIELKGFEKHIKVDNLSFSYGEGEVIKNLSLSVEKGKKIALVGLSGSGKSTLMNLLLGLYPIKEGQIFIDDHCFSKISLESLRNLFGLVSQDVFLFHDSIRVNLCLGREFSSDEMKEALRVAYALDFVEKLPHALDTIIGDQGVLLSGGQQQRLTIARAYLHDSPVLLFDEATSALDNESEKVVQKALEGLAGHKTVIAIAHRLSTIQDFDKIYVMHNGRLVEEGTHEELVHLDGEYSKLYKLSVKT